MANRCSMCVADEKACFPDCPFHEIFSYEEYVKIKRFNNVHHVKETLLCLKEKPTEKKSYAEGLVYEIPIKETKTGGFKEFHREAVADLESRVEKLEASKDLTSLNLVAAINLLRLHGYVPRTSDDGLMTFVPSLKIDDGASASSTKKRKSSDDMIEDDIGSSSMAKEE